LHFLIVIVKVPSPTSHVNVWWVVVKGVNVNQYSLYYIYSSHILCLYIIYGAKILLSTEISIFLFTFFYKSLEVSILFLTFATDSVSPFVWVSGLFTGKGRLRNVSRRYCNENVHDGCIISFRIWAYCYFL